MCAYTMQSNAPLSIIFESLGGKYIYAAGVSCESKHKFTLIVISYCCLSYMAGIIIGQQASGGRSKIIQHSTIFECIWFRQVALYPIQSINRDCIPRQYHICISRDNITCTLTDNITYTFTDNITCTITDNHQSLSLETSLMCENIWHRMQPKY